MIRCQNDTTRTLEVIRPLNVVDRAQFPRTSAASRDTFQLGKRAFRRPMVVDDGVLYFIGLHIEMSARSFLRRGWRLSRSNRRENNSGSNNRSSDRNWCE